MARVAEVANAVVGYFDLNKSRRSDTAVGHAGGGTTADGDATMLLLYIAVTFGVIAKSIVSPTLQAAMPSLGRVVVSIILAIVIFPSVYEQTLAKSARSLPLKICVAFGGGFAYKAASDFGATPQAMTSGGSAGGGTP